MDSLNFKQERATIIENMETLVSQAKEEKRDLTEEETNEFDAFDSTIKDLDKKIERAYCQALFPNPVPLREI